MQWRELEILVERLYTTLSNGYEPPGLLIRLHVCFLQHWFTRSDPATEDALYESLVL